MYLLEYLGTLLVCSAFIMTNSNPILVGLSYTSAHYFNEGGIFNPLMLLINLFLGRIIFSDALKLFAVQIAAALSVVIIYTVPTFLE